MGALKKQWQTQAARIDELMAAHSLNVRVARGAVTPRAFQFDLKAAGELRVETLMPLAGDIAHATGSREASVAPADEPGLLRVVLQRPRSDSVALLELCAQLRSVPPLTAVLGIDANHAPLLLRLSSPAVQQVLIAGMTGSGKTALARAVLTSLAMYNPPTTLQIVLIDPKASGFRALQALPNVLGALVSAPEETLDCLRWLGEELVRREHTRSTHTTPPPALLVAIDELADLVRVGGKRIETLLTQVAQRGGAVGIHLLACTQQPAAELIGSGGSAAFPLRLVGAVASRDAARVASGISNSGADQLQGRGDFLLVVDGEGIRFQAAWLARKELNAIAAHLHWAEGGALNWAQVLHEISSPPPATAAAAAAAAGNAAGAAAHTHRSTLVTPQPGPPTRRRLRAASLSRTPRALLRRLFGAAA